MSRRRLGRVLFIVTVASVFLKKQQQQRQKPDLYSQPPPPKTARSTGGVCKKKDKLPDPYASDHTSSFSVRASYDKQSHIIQTNMYT